MFIGSGDATMAAQNYYCAALIFSLVFQIPPEIVVASTVTTPPPGATHIWVPPYSDYIPASPVRYERKINWMCILAFSKKNVHST